jgi:gas vesicle protein
MVKTTLIFVLVGAIAGATVASFVVPPALAWYTEPGGLPGGAAIPAVVQIPEVIRYATHGLIRGQLIGGGVGAAVGLVLAITIGVRRRRPQKV